MAILTFYLYVIVLLSKQTINQLLFEPGLWMLPEQTASDSICQSTPVSSNTGVCFLWSPHLLSASLPQQRQVSPGRSAFPHPSPGTLLPLSARWVDWIINWEQRKEGRVRDTATQLKNPDQWTRCLRRMMLICWSGWRRKGHPLSLL